MSSLRLAGIVNDSITDGPGLRMTIFVQGCPHNCEGCHNPQTHNFNGGTLFDTDEVIEEIKKNRLLQGVTFSGGEPMCQATALLTIANYVKEQNLELAIYTGYLFEDLIKMSEDVTNLLKLADVLIDGKFELSKKSFNLKFKGSSNQRVIDLKKTFEKGVLILENSDRWN